MPCSKEIKLKAIDFSSGGVPFKASKGWLEKFLARHGYSKNRYVDKVPVPSARQDSHELFIKAEDTFDYQGKEEIQEFVLESFSGF